VHPAWHLMVFLGNQNLAVTRRKKKKKEIKNQSSIVNNGLRLKAVQSKLGSHSFVFYLMLSGLKSFGSEPNAPNNV